MLVSIYLSSRAQEQAIYLFSLAQEQTIEIVRFSWNRGIVPTPPGIMNYATEPWVVSNDRLRDLGWEPSWSNVEAYVDSFDPRPWAMLNAKRRQQVALGGASVGIAAVAGAARVLSKRWRG